MENNLKENNIDEDGKENYICVRCDYKCAYEKDFIKHLTTEKHKNGKRKTRSDKKDMPTIHQCEKCDYNTTHIYNFKTHVLNNHSSLEEKKNGFTYYCECCDYGIFSKDNFDKHLLSKKHIRRSN
jgi:hypothetical protein